MRRVIVLGLLTAAFLAGGARAETIIAIQYMSWGDAVKMVRAGGGHVHRCQRIALRHFRCRATYWFLLHEAEVEPDGSLVNEVVRPFPEELIADVGLKGVRLSATSSPPPGSPVGSE